MADVKDFLAGLFAGVLSLLISHPFDTLKVRQQSFDCSLLSAASKTIKYEGVKGFYKGVAFPLITYGPSNSIFFGIYGNCLKFLENKPNLGHHDINPNNYEDIKRVFQAGCIAGLPQAIFYSPIEYTKIILQANVGSMGKKNWSHHYSVPYKGVMEAIRGIYKEEGIKGLYRGCLAMCIRDVPTSGLYVLSYEMLRFSVIDKFGTSSLGKEVFAGGTAGILNAAASLPVDVVKTSIQTDNPKKPMYKGIIDCTQKLYAEHGIRFFFKGLPVLCLRAFPAHAVMFTSYEYIVSL